MKVHLVNSTRAINVRYTYAMLDYLLRKNKIATVPSISEADLILVSSCDVDGYKLVRDTKKAAGDKPVIMGGCESFPGSAYLAWADYIWVGEGFEFFKALAGGTWADIVRNPAMYSKEKREAVPSTLIDWAEVPLIKGSKRTYYIMMARGCKQKCRFCFVSWANLHQIAPLSFQHHVLASIKELPKGCMVHYISNDNAGLLMNERVACPSVRVVDFLNKWEDYKQIRFAHFGVERFSEWGRREWGKPIDNLDLHRLMIVTEGMSREVEFFFIIGLPTTDDEFKEFLNIVPLGIKLNPKIKLKFTYLDPGAHTPIERFNLLNLVEVDTLGYRRQLLEKNRRFQMFGVRNLPAEMWRVLFHRCDENEVIALGPPPKQKTLSGFVQEIKGKGLGHLLDGQQKTLPWEGIKPAYKYKKRGV